MAQDFESKRGQINILDTGEVLKPVIDAADVETVKRCLEAYCARMLRMLSAMPDEMQPNDLVDWKLEPSRLTEEDVLALEQDLPFRLPPLFRAFLVTYFVHNLDFGEFQLPALPSDNPLGSVELYLFQENLWRIGYAQFASGPCGDPVCFDLQSPGRDGDYPIVTINHDWVKPEDWERRDRVQPFAKAEANSFRTFFTRLCLEEHLAADGQQHDDR